MEFIDTTIDGIWPGSLIRLPCTYKFNQPPWTITLLPGQLCLVEEVDHDAGLVYTDVATLIMEDWDHILPTWNEEQ